MSLIDVCWLNIGDWDCDYDDFYHDLSELVKKSKKELGLKFEDDLEFDTLKIFDPKITSLGMDQNRLNDLTELAYTTVEHHGFLNK